ncbi:MAG: recombinase family protein [bacterium]
MDIDNSASSGYSAQRQEVGDTMRCAIYARYSSDLQRDRSIDDQIRNCSRFAEQKGWVVLDGHKYTDRAVSGASAIGRTGLSDLLRVAQTLPHSFDYLLVDDTSRLSRKPGEVESIIERLRFYDIHIYFVSQGINSADKQAHLSVGVNSLLDSQYRRDLASKTLRGMAGQALRGFNTCGRLYGYQYVMVEDDTGTTDRKTGRPRVVGTRIEIDSDQANVVREIFQLFNEGLGIRDITHHLNEKGHAPPGRRRLTSLGKAIPGWIPGTVRNILRNPKYAGDWTFNKTGWVTNPETGQRKRIVKDRGEWVENPQPALAIIDKATWDKVQRRTLKNKRGSLKKSRFRSRFLFSGLIKCQICGGSYIVVTGTDRPNPLYACGTNHHRGKVACPNIFKVGRREIEKKILGDIQLQLLNPSTLSSIVKLINKTLRQKLRVLRKSSPALLVEKEKLDRQASNIIDAIANGFRSDDLKKRLSEVEARRAEIDRQHTALNSKLSYNRLKVESHWVRGWLGRMSELFEADPLVAKAKLTSLLGEFTLSPEVIDGNKYLRVRSEADIGGLIGAAAPKNSLHLREYWGAELNCRPPDPQSGALTN